jgi:predicted DNA binding protein
METKDSKKYQEYIKMRNQVKGLVRKIKANMEKEIAKNAKKNPKKFWQYANSKRKTKSGISELKYKKENGVENKTTRKNYKMIWMSYTNGQTPGYFMCTE